MFFLNLKWENNQKSGIFSEFTWIYHWASHFFVCKLYILISETRISLHPGLVKPDPTICWKLKFLPNVQRIRFTLRWKPGCWGRLPQIIQHTWNSGNNKKKKGVRRTVNVRRILLWSVTCVQDWSSQNPGHEKKKTLSRWQGASVSPCKCWHLSIPSLDGLSYRLEQLSPSLCGKYSQFGLKAGAVCVFFVQFLLFLCPDNSCFKAHHWSPRLPATALCIRSFCGVESF